MWGSVRDALSILVGGNLGEVGFTVVSTALAGRPPLGPRQFLLINLLTDMLPAMTIAMRPPPAGSDAWREAPDTSLGSSLRGQILLRSVTTAGGGFAGWTLGRATGTRRRAGTIALVSLVGTQLGQTAVLGRSSPAVLASAAVSFVVLGGIVQTPGVSQAFGCTPLGPLGWGIGLGSAAGATGASVVLPAVWRSSLFEPLRRVSAGR